MHFYIKVCCGLLQFVTVACSMSLCDTVKHQHTLQEPYHKGQLSMRSFLPQQLLVFASPVLDSSTTNCVVVVHQQISQLSSSGLMNIESSHKFNRSGDTAYGCIVVNMHTYQVGVVGGNQGYE